MQTILKFMLALTVVAVLGNKNLAHATPAFLKKFQDLYAGPKSPPGFADKVAKTKCNVCHVEGEKKSVNNEYGQALQKSGLKKEMAKDLSKGVLPVIQAVEKAFDDAAKEKNSEGESFGDRIKAGKLPAE